MDATASRVSEGTGGLTEVDRSLCAVSTASATETRLQAAGTTSGPVLSWGVVPLDDKGALPAAMVTWPGHAATTSAGATVPTGTGAAAYAPAGTAGTAGLDGLPMGSGLVEVLAGVEVADTDDAVLLDVAARWQELISWATAMQSRALGEIGRRRGWTEEHNAAAAEISARLRVPQDDANKLMARGAGLAEHPQVMDALRVGVIDTAKADILLRSGNPLTTEEREEAITLYLPKAPDRSRGWLREKMNAFANRLKGTLETTRHAMTRRAVYLDPADNTMAWLSAHLPATDAAAVWDAVDTTAHILRRTPGATRTLAQARADALVALATGRVIVPPQPECAPQTDEGTATDSDAPGTPRPTAPAANPASAGTATGGTATGGTATKVSRSPSGSAEEVDAPPLPRTTVPAAGCTCGGCTCGGTAVRIIPVKPQIRVTVSADMLLGLDDSPGQLQGYGPIPADIAAQLATDATWQRLVTDPVTGILTDYSTTTYQPGKILRQAVAARDHTCCFLQCDRPAHWADLDHIVPFDHHLDPADQPPGTPGQTRAQNLQPLCRAHHLAKTHHGWKVTRGPESGVTTWTAPTGHTYTRPPTATGTTAGTSAGTSTGHVSNDTTSLMEDTRARLGQPPLDRHTAASADGRPAGERLTYGQPHLSRPYVNHSRGASPTTLRSEGRPASRPAELRRAS